MSRNHLPAARAGIDDCSAWASVWRPWKMKYSESNTRPSARTFKQRELLVVHEYGDHGGNGARNVHHQPADGNFAERDGELEGVISHRCADATGRGHRDCPERQGKRCGKIADHASMASVAQPNTRTTSTDAWQFLRSADFDAHPNKPKESVPRKQKSSPLFMARSWFPRCPTASVASDEKSSAAFSCT